MQSNCRIQTNKYGLFAGTTYKQDDEEADKIYDSVDQSADARRRARRCVILTFDGCQISGTSNSSGLATSVDPKGYLI